MVNPDGGTGYGGPGGVPLKPLSSPRSSQPHTGGSAIGQQDKGPGAGAPAADPNTLYQ